MNFLRKISFPVSAAYWIAVVIRNKLYDWKLFRSKSFDIPTIGVGNLTVGGTGKSPSIEYLIRLLSPKYKVATLSRGYGRKTKGFVLASALSLPEEIGDEPTQFKQKFNDITVSVCENRAKGIEELKGNHDVILLDDAFQHRSVKTGLSILLFDYNKVFDTEWMLPFGNLREPMSGISRANYILVTKTPKIFSPMERRRVEARIRTLPHQQIFYSYLRYGDLQPVYTRQPERAFADLDKKTQVVLLTGIADATLLKNYLESLKLRNITHLEYPDHHVFTANDMKRLKRTVDGIESENKVVITTEKDAMRLRNPKLEMHVPGMPVYYVPIESEIQEKDKESFDKIILDYVGSGTKYN